MPADEKTPKNHDALKLRGKKKKRRRLLFVAGALTGIVIIYSAGTSAKEIITPDEAFDAASHSGGELNANKSQQDLENTDSAEGATEQESLTTEQVPEEELQPHIVNYTINDGDIPADILIREGGYDHNDIAALLSAAEGIYDFTSVRIDKTLTFIFDIDDHGEGAKAREIRYEPNGSKAIIALRTDNGFDVSEEKIEYEVEWEKKEVEISNFLYVDALNEGISEATIIGVGDVFSYTIDFASEIREGDTLTILYEKRTRDGEIAKDGKILAAKFTASGEDFYAYHFDADEADEEFGGYYDEQARVLERQFLKAPLDFFRITSGYTGRRLHPVINKYTTHYQIDYAAPSGTPTFATSRGTVTSAGWENGWGNIVRLRHSGGYTTHYAHLSGFAKGIKKGTKVEQGETIGFVGSTGWSTGPHVDYGMKLNGSPVNPLKIELPKGEPIEQSQKEAFLSRKAEYDQKLEI